MATITKRGAGWFAQVRRQGYGARYRTFASKMEAARWAREQELQMDRGEPDVRRVSPLGERLKLGNLIGRYLERVTPRKRGAASETLRLRKMMKAPLCHLSLDELKPDHFADYRDRRLAQVKPATVRRELGLFRVVLATARREWGIWLPSNPMEDVKRPIAHDCRDRRLRAGEAERLDQALLKSRNGLWRPLVWFLVETGLRRGEMLRLEWRFVDLESRTAHIPTTKSGQPRTIPLTDRAVNLLSQLPCNDARVFPVTAAALRQCWVRTLRKAGIGDLRIHDLRHEAISRFSELGLNTPELASISGHKDVRMLVRYTHPRPAELARKLAGRSWEAEVGRVTS